LYRTEQAQPSAAAAARGEPGSEISDPVADQRLGQATELGDDNLTHLTLWYPAILGIEYFQDLHIVVDVPNAPVIGAFPGEWSKLGRHIHVECRYTECLLDQGAPAVAERHGTAVYHSRPDIGNTRLQNAFGNKLQTDRVGAEHARLHASKQLYMLVDRGEAGDLMKLGQ
jgi:hypothetical protein